MKSADPAALKPPRLVHLAEYGQLRAGSFIPMLAAVFEKAKGCGWAVDAVFPAGVEGAPWVDDLRALGVRLHLCPVEGRRARTRWLREEFGDEVGSMVIHTHFTAWDVPAVLGFRAKPDAVIIWHLHTTLGRTRLSKLRNSIKFATLGRRVAAFLCPAENIAEDVRARHAPQGRVHFVPSAVRLDSFPLLDASARRRAREELGVPADAIVLLHFGWHWYLKGGDTFLETVQELRERGAPRLLGIERGADDAGPAVARMGLSDVVRIQPMVDDTRTLFGAADVLVTSSRSEGMAYAVLESLCSGTPVVATNIPGHAYIGEHVPACRIVRRDPDALADAILELTARGPEQVSEEAEQAREWIATNLSVEANADRLAEFYEEALRSLMPAAG